MGTYVKEQGYGSFEHFLDSVEAVKEMVFYHLIDGEANDAGNYETAGFTSGSIDTKNMLGRYLYTSIAPDGTAWMINNSARIVSGDHMLVNGVVQKLHLPATCRMEMDVLIKSMETTTMSQ